jgi:hypothetical protein
VPVYTKVCTEAAVQEREEPEPLGMKASWHMHVEDPAREKEFGGQGEQAVEAVEDE